MSLAVTTTPITQVPFSKVFSFSAFCPISLSVTVWTSIGCDYYIFTVLITILCEKGKCKPNFIEGCPSSVSSKIILDHTHRCQRSANPIFHEDPQFYWVFPPFFQLLSTSHPPFWLCFHGLSIMTSHSNFCMGDLLGEGPVSWVPWWKEHPVAPPDGIICASVVFC